MKLHPAITDLLRDIDAFIGRFDMTPTDFGLLSIGDPNLYRHLKNGRNPRFATLDRIRSFMRKREERAA
jgi:DNA-binding phage protein